MTDSYAWVALHALKKISLKNKITLVELLGSADSVMRSSEGTLSALKVPLAARQAIMEYQMGKGALREAVESVRNWLRLADNHHLLTYGGSDYPPLLKEISDPPLVLMVKGDFKILHQAQIAVVGSRRASRQGIENAKLFSAGLAHAGVVVTSGLALGIDAAAHGATLPICGKTIAVLGTGPDLTYPNKNKMLCSEIVNCGGAVVTEFLPGTPPLSGHFPQRNRIIAGLTLGVLVIEAALKSGSLITARLSLEYNREVFALPGSIHNTQSRGCNELIRDGAQLINSTEQIFEQIPFSIDESCQKINSPIEPIPRCEYTQESSFLLMEAMQWDELTIDEISSLTSLEITELIPLLISLELEGIISKNGDKFQRLIAKK